MDAIVTSSYAIYFNQEAYSKLREHLKAVNYSKIFVLVDENTKDHCLAVFLEELGVDIAIHVLSIRAGEQHKNIESCMPVWDSLSEQGADRQSLLINLGGGVVTDLGGFVASTFKRGIPFINVPTSLLAMVDASIGGKTGVDLGSLKNQIGVINQPQMVLVVSAFLKTLDTRELRSGFAEMLKHGLITNEGYWAALKDITSYKALDGFIRASIEIKNEVVVQDPTEKNLRKILNFGHTLGHAIESHCLASSTRETVLHGEAIAAGMILESYLSHKLLGLGLHQLEDIKETFIKHYGRIDFSEVEIEAILDLLKYDKKNTHGHINFVLLKRIGETLVDNQVPHILLTEAFAYYKD